MTAAARASVLAASVAAGAAIALAAADASAQFRMTDIAERFRAAGHPRALAGGDGRLPLTLQLPSSVDARDLGAISMGRDMAALHLLPEQLTGFVAAHPDVIVDLAPRRRPLLDKSGILNRTLDYRTRTSQDGTGVVVGIVDTGIDALHDDFRDANGKTRIAWYLDDSRAALGLHPDLEHQFGCDDPQKGACAILSADDIDAAIAGNARIGVPTDGIGHGTHVASIAAGNGGKDAKYVGGAPGATLVVARVTRGPDEGVTDPDIALATQFIFDRAEHMQPAPMPAVVNISLGGDFGPHDGTTDLEKMLASLVGADQPGRSIVVAAGNSGPIYAGSAPGARLGSHTQARVARGSPVRIKLRSPEGTGSQRLDGGAYVWITFRPGSDIAIGLEGPGSVHIGPVPPGNEGDSDPSDPYIVAGVFNGVVTSVSPLPAETHGAVAAWSGQWDPGAEAELVLDGEGFADLWVEGAGDAAPGAIDEGELFEVAMVGGTINVPATHPALISVGCTINRNDWVSVDDVPHVVQSFGPDDPAPPPDSECYFSSAGPTETGVMKPEISAPGALVAAAMSHSVAPGAGIGASIFDPDPALCSPHAGQNCMLVDSTHALLSGSSMSAPQATGAIALLLERDPMLTQPQIAGIVQAGARRPAGIVRRGDRVGVGALDMSGMEAAYEAGRSSEVGEPDPARSWLALSTTYARPDPTWPVVGKVVLRTAEDKPADGFDAGSLALEATNALVLEPLTRVAPGLFQFQVAARDGSGQDTMHIEVTYRGAVIGPDAGAYSGTRALPIGIDANVAFGQIVAHGSVCSVAMVGRASREARHRSSTAAVLALAALGSAIGARRAGRDRSPTRPRA